MTLGTLPTKLEVVPLVGVKDIGRSLGFYKKIGFKLKESWKPNGVIQWCRLEFNQAALMLQATDNPDARQIVSLHHTDIQLYFITDDVEQMYRHLCSIGYKVAPPTLEFYGMKQIFLKDPDGRTLCFESKVESL